MLEALIGPDGKVKDVRVIQSTPPFDEAAMDAVRQWEFEPTQIDGKAVSVVMTTTVTFNIRSTQDDQSSTGIPESASLVSTKQVRTATRVCALFLMIGGCNPPLPPPPPAFSREPAVPDRERRHSPSDRTHVLAELERQKARWYREAPYAYELKVSRSCFCDPGTPWVSRNEGSAVVSSSGGHFRDGRSVGPPLRNIEQVFADHERLRENLKALGDSREERDLRTRYLAELTQQEDTVKDLRAQSAALDQQIQQHEAAAAKLVSELAWQ